MRISTIKQILTAQKIPADQINLIISTVNIEDLDDLSEFEKENLKEIVSGILVMAQDPSSGAYVNDPEKAKSILSAIERFQA
ncbi:hypothetical protein [Luteimonas sp. e5]|jgi:hypothetical protein